jgi:hypothetical protein
MWFLVAIYLPQNIILVVESRRFWSFLLRCKESYIINTITFSTIFAHVKKHWIFKAWAPLEMLSNINFHLLLLSFKTWPLNRPFSKYFLCNFKISSHWLFISKFEQIDCKYSTRNALILAYQPQKGYLQGHDTFFQLVKFQTHPWY